MHRGRRPQLLVVACLLIYQAPPVTFVPAPRTRPPPRQQLSLHSEGGRASGQDSLVRLEQLGTPLAARLRGFVRPRGGFWGPHAFLGFLTLAATLTYFAYLWSPSPGFYAFGLPRLVDVERHFSIAGYRCLLWSTLALSSSGLLRMPDGDPEVRKNFFRFQSGAALYGTVFAETGIARSDPLIDIFDGPGLVLFLLLSGVDFALALYWMYSIIAVPSGDSDVVAGVKQRSATTVVAALVGPTLGAGGLIVPPLFSFPAGRAMNSTFLAEHPGLEAATLNAVVGLTLIGNVAVLCLTATRRGWLTNAQALPVVLLSFGAGFYDLIAYASDSGRRAEMDRLNANAYGLHVPEAMLAVVLVTFVFALLQSPGSADQKRKS